MRFILTVMAIFILCGGVVGCLTFGPNYNVYTKEMQGKAAYAEAQGNRKIAVLEATAKKESALLLGEAQLIQAQQAALSEVARAKGTAEANAIVADGLGGPEGYLRYLYIDKLATGDGRETIYVPTEGGLPILAGRPR
jgi:hypothetical protein